MLLLSTFAYADGFARGVFQLSNAQAKNQYEFIAQYPVGKHSAQTITWPQGCKSLQANQYQSNDLMVQTFLIECEAPLANGAVIAVPYQIEAAVLELQLGAWQARNIVTSTKAGIKFVLQTGPAVEKSLPEIAAEYFGQGIVHIWFGWDHLAFVFALCILAEGFRQLFWTITAFTIGHSISMAVSFFKWVTIPISPIEAIIAVSIVLIAREAWLRMNQAEHKAKSGGINMIIVVALFGLVHGLGFASALEKIGVAAYERVPALIFFNVGVEAGQIAFVVMITGVTLILDKVNKTEVFSRVALISVGAAGSFWAIERIGSFNW